MQDLLDHLVKYWSFLWASARYRIVDSMVSTHFGGDAFLVASDGLRLRFVRDRGQLFLEVQARLPEIESMFSSKESFKATKVKLEELKSLRAKEMFG